MWLGLRLCATFALLLSAATGVDYYGSGGHGTTFCGEGSGCDVVRHSQLGESIGQGLPGLGLLGFAFVLLASLSSRRGLRLAALAAATTGGVAAALLLLLQWLVIGTFCSLCVGVDLAAIGAGAFSVEVMRRGEAMAGVDVRRGVWAALAMLAAGTPVALAATRAPELPPYIASLGQPGKLNVVEISDFECPHCRAMHPHLMQALAPYGSRVHFTRKSFPLPGHRHARDATRAYLCALAQDKGEAMADALFSAADLSAPACVKLAGELGLDLQAFAECVASDETERTIERDMRAIRESGFEGLPTVWIGDEALKGFDRSAGAGRYADALARAAGQRAAPAAWMPWAVVLALATVAYVLGRGSAGASARKRAS